MLHLVKKQVFHERTKHIDVQYHFTRDIIQKGSVKVAKVCTKGNDADMLTNSLPAENLRL